MLPETLPQLAMAFPNIDPVMFTIFGLPIRWYSLSYIVGILLGWWYAKRIVRNNRLWGGRAPMTEIDLDDFVVWAILGVVLGGRLGYVILYDWPLYAANPMAILQAWNGGMSFHGGFIGVTIAMLIFARARKIPVWCLFDVVAVVVPIGLGLGRIANFINGELWGRVTDVPWAVIFPRGGPFARHPSQLYEAALEGLVLLIILAIAVYRFKVLRRPGFASGLLVAGYGAARTFVEFFREPDAQLGYLYGDWLTRGMQLSIPMIIIGLILMIMAKPVKFVDPAPSDAEADDAA